MSFEKEVWVFDAKWVPDPVAGRLLYRLPDTMSDPDVLSEMARRRGGDDPSRFRFPRMLCRLVCVSAVIRRVGRGGAVSLRLHTVPEDIDHAEGCRESDVLLRFLSGIGARRPHTVVLNEEDADIKMMAQRALTLGLSIPALTRSVSRRTWMYERIFTNFFTNGGPMTPHELAALSGIPGRPDADGSEIGRMWYEGHITGIVQCNEFDALTSYLMWLRFTHFNGGITSEEFSEEAERLERMLIELSAEERSRHVGTFLSVWKKLELSRLLSGG
jgi:predicted PolB exonuclease-like 3'-5' exonuclease